jgi:hypothetical protein
MLSEHVFHPRSLDNSSRNGNFEFFLNLPLIGAFPSCRTSRIILSPRIVITPWFSILVSIAGRVTVVGTGF